MNAIIPATCMMILVAFVPLRAQDTRPADGNLDLAPLVEVGGQGNMEVSVFLVNTGDKSINYPWSRDPLWMNGVSWVLSQNGKDIPEIGKPREFLHPRREDMRELKPGESLRLILSLKERYGDLAHGMYRLDIRYAPPPFVVEVGASAVSLRAAVYVVVK